MVREGLRPLARTPSVTRKEGQEEPGMVKELRGPLPGWSPGSHGLPSFGLHGNPSSIQTHQAILMMNPGLVFGKSGFLISQKFMICLFCVVAEILRNSVVFESSGISKLLCAMTDFQHGAAAEGI